MSTDEPSIAAPDQAEAPAWSALLDAVTASPQFRDSPRQRDLLRYLAGEELAGRGEQLNAYSIAFDVLHRDSTFDAANDSSVRVEMHRLRQNLAEWNADPANGHLATLEIPPRSYRPVLKPRTAGTAHDRKPAVLSNRRGTLIVAGMALGLSLLGGFAFWSYRSASECRSARPELALPSQIENVDPERSRALLARLETFLGYYPLVTALHNGATDCGGTPRYNLKIVFGVASVKVV